MVSRPVLQWIAAIRGLYRYRLLTSNSNTCLGKTGLCPHCKASKHPLVVREYRLACFDFLNPRCSDNVAQPLQDAPHIEAASTTGGSSTTSALAAKATSKAQAFSPASMTKDPPSPRQIVGCTGCLSDTSSALHFDALADPDLALFVATAPKITRQRPQGPKLRTETDAATEQGDVKTKASTSTAAPAAFKLDPSKHPFLKADHRSMKWAIMHHEYKRAVYSWFHDE